MTAKHLLNVCASIVVASAIWSCDAPAMLEPDDPRTPPEIARALSGRIDLDANGDHFLYWSIDTSPPTTGTIVVPRSLCMWGFTQGSIPGLVYNPQVDTEGPTRVQENISSKLSSELVSGDSNFFDPKPFSVADGKFERIWDHVTITRHTGELKVWEYHRVDGVDFTGNPAIYPITYTLLKSHGLFNVPCHDQGGGG